MKNPDLIIDPGHGGADPGGGSNNMFKEKDMVLKISLYQAKRFGQLGVPVALTRDSDKYLSPNERGKKIVAKSGAKLCISNHINSATPTARGAETIHSLRDSGQLATQILQAIVDCGMAKRRVFTRESETKPGADYYFMHSYTKPVQTIIIEYGFASNAIDSKLLVDNWQAYAEAVVRVVTIFLGYRYEPEKGSASVKIPEITMKTNLVVNGEKSSDNAYVIDGTVYVPLRTVGEGLGATVHWDNQTKTASLTKGVKL